jgi:hypothetical protein
MDAQALIAERAVEGFDVGVVCRPTRAGEIHGDLVLVGPLVKGLATEFATVVSLQPFGNAVTDGQLLQQIDNLFALDVLVSVDG